MEKVVVLIIIIIIDGKVKEEDGDGTAVAPNRTREKRLYFLWIIANAIILIQLST